MAIYRVSMIVRNHPGFDSKAYGPESRVVVTNFAGCANAEDAKRKALGVYDVLKFKKIELTDAGLRTESDK